MSDLLYVGADHPLQNINGRLKAKLLRAQQNLVDKAFSSAGDLCARAIEDLKINVAVPAALKSLPVSQFADRPFTQMTEDFRTILVEGGVPEQAATQEAWALAMRFQLVRAFDDPDSVIAYIKNKVTEVVARFPRTAEDIECGKNPGDVIDPYILAATQFLVYGGSFDQAIGATVAHKTLMMIEDLMGHLHEDVIGEMRGNVRVPEPRGEDQEQVDPERNPFPGADVVQPPLAAAAGPRFHQLKNKTGSAKGGDGKRLGEQLAKLQQIYGGEIYYDALIGTTLRGHRSRAAVEKAAPSVVVLVGEAAFEELTRSKVGPQLLLRVYQSAFQEVATDANYNAESMAVGIVQTFRARADREATGYLESILEDVTGGPRSDQDSRKWISPLRLPTSKVKRIKKK